MLGSAGDVEPGDPGRLQLVLQGHLQLLDHLFALGASGRHLGTQGLVVLGLEVLEREVLQFGLDAGHTEPVSEWGVDLPGLGGDP